MKTPFMAGSIRRQGGLGENSVRYLREAIDARDFSMPAHLVDAGREWDAFKDDPEFKRQMALVRQPAQAP
jgi:hypothetical protein